MTELPVPTPLGLLTIAEYTALPEALSGRYELQEGSFVVSPGPPPEHQMCVLEVLYQLDGQVPAHLEFVHQIDLDLGLAPPDRPGFARVPDVVVGTQMGFDRCARERTLLHASEVVLVVEVLHEGSRRTDRIIKHGEYADAGIPHYWIIDMDAGPTLTACHQAGEFGYADAPAVSGVFTTDEPFPIRLDLDQLT